MVSFVCFIIMSILGTYLIYKERGLSNNYYKNVFTKSIWNVSEMKKMKPEEASLKYQECFCMIIEALPVENKIINFIKKTLRIIGTLLFIYAMIRGGN